MDPQVSIEEGPDAHPFIRFPHRTMAYLSVPVLLSLVVEPLAGLADTAFVVRLGAAPTAGLGVATTLLSGVLWIFNFIGIGTQTEVARSLGVANRSRAAEATALAIGVAAVLGIFLALSAWPCLDAAASFMGANGDMRAPTLTYLRIRLLGVPATLSLLAAFGALRGIQDMRTPLWIAAVASAFNIALDPILIFGYGSVPAFGIAGAAWATTLSQWLGAVWAVLATRRRLGLRWRARVRDAVDLLVVGRDLFLRTGSLLLFLVLATRAATRIGAGAGAAHQAIRQVWVFTALLLDAYAATAQSLVGYFLGGGRIDLARRVSAVACFWGFATGILLAAAMIAGEPAVAALLVAPSARAVFSRAWLVSALAQPLNALSFATDGIHWGTGDYRYLRNGMLLATAAGSAALLVPHPAPPSLVYIWLITSGWIAIRAIVGIGRIWPAWGRAPLSGAPLG